MRMSDPRPDPLRELILAALPRRVTDHIDYNLKEATRDGINFSADTARQLAAMSDGAAKNALLQLASILDELASTP